MFWEVTLSDPVPNLGGTLKLGGALRFASPTPVIVAIISISQHFNQGIESSMKMHGHLRHCILHDSCMEAGSLVPLS